MLNSFEIATHPLFSSTQARESSPSPRAETFNAARAVFLASTSPSPSANSAAIAASVALVASIILLAAVFAVLWKRLPQKRRHHVEMGGRSRRPLLRPLETEFPAEMKPAYLDSPRPRRASLIAQNPLSPLAACQQPGFVPRPVPVNVPMSVDGSDVASARWNARQSSISGVTDLADIQNELSRHYVLTEPTPPVPRHTHRYSASLTGRSRVFHEYL
ncbi:hypothetical protein FB451DRAFT_212077 [Mycena latifolia]|nr:hypothetical protein FB451DRAFT_212077 [Mycena latifolia]